MLDLINSSVPQIFDRNLQRLAYLDGASVVNYDLPLNALWTAGFRLPADDPKNEYCQPLNFVELYDGETRIDLFRIIGEDLSRSDEAYRVYNCEHALATLLNDVLFQYHQIGGLGVYTEEVLEYILSKQSVERWVLDECEFTRQFEYNFENSNLLAALFSVPNCFDMEYMWTWDTTVYPWKLSLVEPPDELQAEIRYRKNLLGIQRTKDATKIINRVYALGYGEGVNQLTIKSVNSGVPYVEDLTSQAQYGVISTILVDGRFEIAANLKAYAQRMLDEAAQPYYSYTVDSLDLFRLEGDDTGRMWPGLLCRVEDEEDDITVRARIVEVSKPDVRDDPGAITVTLANKEENLAGSISDLQHRALINETYAQGATNLAVQNFADNADEDHPATLKVWIPASAVRINRIVLSVSFEPFRGYSKAVSNAPASTSGAGGGCSPTSDAVVLTPQNTIDNSSSGGAGAANHNHGMQLADDGAGNLTEWICVCDGAGNYIRGMGFVPSGSHTHQGHRHTVEIDDHTHTIPSHGHNMEYGIYEGGSVDTAVIRVDGNVVQPPSHEAADASLWTRGTLSSAAGAEQNTSSVKAKRIRTGYLLQTEVTAARPASGYQIQAYVYTAGGTYKGIWNGTNLGTTVTWFSDKIEFSNFNSSYKVRLVARKSDDSNWTNTTDSDLAAQSVYLTYADTVDWDAIDIVTYLDTDGGGKITRDTWHTVEIQPAGKSRVVAALFTQLFANSRGGGDY